MTPVVIYGLVHWHAMFRLRNFLQSTLTTSILLLAASSVVAQQQPVRQQGSLTKDLSQGATFAFKIAANLPEFTFKIIPELQEEDQDENAGFGVRDIEVFVGDAKKPSQHLTGCDLNGAQPLPFGSDWFRADDFNFDGYKDVYLLTNYGVTGNRYGCIWLYNPATKNFEYNKEFSALSRIWLDPTTKTIFTFSTGGAAGRVHTAEKYAVKNNRLVLIWSENQDLDDERRRFHCVVEERRRTQMVTIRDEWGMSADGEGPCDASKLFQGLHDH
jgi:hypothetical protein